MTGWRVMHRRGGSRINEGRDMAYPAECLTSRFNRWQIRRWPS